MNLCKVCEKFKCLECSKFTICSQVEKFVSVKGLSYDLIPGCKEFIKVRDAVVNLMKKCEGISVSMQKVVSDLIHSNFTMDTATQITRQPALLNPELVILFCFHRTTHLCFHHE